MKKQVLLFYTCLTAGFIILIAHCEIFTVAKNPEYYNSLTLFGLRMLMYLFVFLFYHLITFLFIKLIKQKTIEGKWQEEWFEQELKQLVKAGDKPKLKNLIAKASVNGNPNDIYASWAAPKNVGEYLVEILQLPIQKKWYQFNYSKKQKQIIERAVEAI
jgi:hypothetical protein